MKKIITALLAASLLAAMTCASASEAGSVADPLITKSYAEGQYAESLASTLTASALSALQAVYDRALSSLDPGGSLPQGQYTNGRELMSLPAGTVISLFTGGTLILMSGDMSLSIKAGDVVDASSGKVFTGGELKQNVRYVCVEDTLASFTAFSDCAVIMEGSYRPDGTVVIPKPPTPVFDDVPSGAWFAEAVGYAVEKGIMDGVGGGRFSPTADTTRAQLVTILYRLENEPAVAPADFTDVPSGQWYSNAVSWAAANGIVGGYGNGTFGPMNALTREQMAKILYGYAQYKGVDVSVTAGLEGYRDASSVQSWAVEPMGWAIASGLISGTSPDTLSPAGSSVRAQTATVLMRLCENILK